MQHNSVALVTASHASSPPRAYCCLIYWYSQCGLQLPSRNLRVFNCQASYTTCLYNKICKEHSFYTFHVPFSFSFNRNEILYKNEFVILWHLSRVFYYWGCYIKPSYPQTPILHLLFVFDVYSINHSWDFMLLWFRFFIYVTFVLVF